MPIIAVIGPSGAGKSTLVDMYLAEHPNAILHKSITTRPTRSDDDTSHTFVTDAEFDALEQQGKLIQPVSAYGYRYALPALPTDTPGAVFVLIRAEFVPPFLKLYPQTRVIQIEAPVDILVGRLTKRGDIIRANKDLLERELLAGRKVAAYNLGTNTLVTDSYKELLAVLRF